MALPTGPYQGQDLINYEAGNKFLPRQFYSLYPNTPPPSIANASTGITNTQAAVPYIWPPQGGGGGGGGGGVPDNIWGYDPNVSKQFDIQTWDRTGDPVHDFDQGEYGWVDKSVTGYQSPTGWKTAEGKNIQNLGIDYTPLPLQALGIGKKIQGNRPGEIKGTFSDVEDAEDAWNLTKKKVTNIPMIKRWRENKQIQKEKRIADEIAADNLKAAQASAAAQQAAKTGPARSHTGEAIAAGDLRDIGGGFHEYKDSGTASKYEGSFAQGGRIGYRNGEFVDENINVEGPGFDVNENIEMVEGGITEEQKAMVLDMLERGMDLPTIISITGVEEADIISLMGGEAAMAEDQGIASLV